MIIEISKKIVKISKNLLQKSKKCYNIYELSLYSICKGEMTMADIYEFVKKSDNRRPVYTSYELSKMVREKRKDENLTISEFAIKYGTDDKMVEEIELGSCSFSPKVYRVCGSILNLSSEELLAEVIDDEATANFRTSDRGEGVESTFKMANMLFNEIIMQKKIGTN